MDKKKFDLFSKGLLILYEGIAEKYNVDIIGLKTRLVEDQEEEEPAEDPAS